MLISQKLEQLSVRYNDARRTVATYLLDHKTEVDGRPMQYIADETCTSKATLVRVAKQLGYTGWTALVRAYVDELKYQASHFDTNTDHNVPFKAGASPSDIADALCQVHMESAWQSNQLLNARTLVEATDILVRAQRIALFGISVNELLLKLFQRKLNTIDVYPEMVAQAESRWLAHSLGPDDCAVIISYSGNNERRIPMSLVPILERRHVPIVALTSEGDNYLRAHATCALSIYSQERIYAKISTFSTEASISYLPDCLFSCLFARNYDRNLTCKVETTHEIETEHQEPSTPFA